MRNFNDILNKPLHQSYQVFGSGKLFAGEYPGDKDEVIAKEKIEKMYCYGICHFVDLTEEGELSPYNHLLPDDTTYTRFSIRDCGVPKSVEDVQRLLLHIEELKNMQGYVYITVEEVLVAREPLSCATCRKISKNLN